MSKKCIAIVYHFNDQDWLGGRNYFFSLFCAIEKLQNPEMKFLFITGNKIKTTLPKSFPWLQVYRTSLIDRLTLSWFIRKLSIKFLNRDFLLEKFLKNLKVDILSHSGQLGHQSTIKTIDWLYDFQFMYLPEYWQLIHIKRITERYNNSCKNSSAIIVSSNDALKDLNKFAPWSTTPKYVLQFTSNPFDLDSIPSKKNILTKYNLPEEFFYLPNQFWKNKNHFLVIDALVILKKTNQNVTVVCTGKTYDGRLPDYFDELSNYCLKKEVQQQFKILGVVPYIDTQSLMLHSCAVINPSLFEGWSTTVEEAKSFQKPLLLSDIPVHREQAQEFANFFSSNSPEQLAQLMLLYLKKEHIPVSNNNLIDSYNTRLSDFGKTYLKIIDEV